jgi:hypothetical protein
LIFFSTSRSVSNARLLKTKMFQKSLLYNQCPSVVHLISIFTWIFLAPAELLTWETNTDAFTKYAEIWAIPNKEAKTVADMVFAKWIGRYVLGCHTNSFI